jgi:PTS system mannose-specific IIA component
MFGGTPTNISAMFLKENEVEIVTGVNLPMVIKLASQNKQMTLRRNGERCRSAGKQSIYRTGRVARTAKTEKGWLEANVKSLII